VDEVILSVAASAAGAIASMLITSSTTNNNCGKDSTDKNCADERRGCVIAWISIMFPVLVCPIDS
jgi:hypothetical protein